MIKYDNNLKIFYSSLINDDLYFSGFGTRALGDARRHPTNIINFLKNNKIDYQTLFIPEQIHSTNIEVFQKETNESLVKVGETDGLITKDKGVILTVVTADCCPIIFSEEKAGIIGISHQGWRGSIKRMVQKMISKMIDLGAKIDQIKLAIGPTIGECCYDIDDDRYFQFLSEFDGYSKEIFHFRKGRWHLNLAKLNYLLAVNIGVKKENIDFFPFCTQCDKNHFFSYRRYKQNQKEEYGEMFSFILKS